jgi:hypothetical protein
MRRALSLVFEIRTSLFAAAKAAATAVTTTTPAPRRSRIVLVLRTVVLVVGASQAPGPAATFATPPPPSVIGPRDTTSTRPSYTFRARGAVQHECAFDDTFLDRCARRFSQVLEPGNHVLRVRAVLRKGRKSRTAVVRVRIRLAVPELQLGASIRVGPGAGVPAIGAGAVWVPTTSDGMLVRVDPASGAVTARVRVGPPTSPATDLDSAVFEGGAVWVASDTGAQIARVDLATNAVTTRITTTARRGGLAAGGGFVWAFHFRQ